MPGPDPDFPYKWTNFFDMLDNIRIWTSTTSNSVVRFDPPQSVGFWCEATGDRWEITILDIANTLQGGPDEERAQLVTSWMQAPGFPELMSFINYYG